VRASSRRRRGSGASIWKLSEVNRHKSLDTLRDYVRQVEGTHRRGVSVKGDVMIAVRTLEVLTLLMFFAAFGSLIVVSGWVTGWPWWIAVPAGLFTGTSFIAGIAARAKWKWESAQENQRQLSARIASERAIKEFLQKDDARERY
jgi:hypothetical protein